MEFYKFNQLTKINCKIQKILTKSIKKHKIKDQPNIFYHDLKINLLFIIFLMVSNTLTLKKSRFKIFSKRKRIERVPTNDNILILRHHKTWKKPIKISPKNLILIKKFKFLSKSLR